MVWSGASDVTRTRDLLITNSIDTGEIRLSSPIEAFRLGDLAVIMVFYPFFPVPTFRKVGQNVGQPLIPAERRGSSRGRKDWKAV